jgi:hypothetical protein
VTAAAVGAGYVTARMDPAEHRDAVLELWKQNLSDERIRNVLDRRFDWFYRSNPEGQPRTVLAIHRPSGDVVGCGSLFPRRMWMLGTPITVGIPADFAVTARHRIGGAALSIQRALIDTEREGFAFLLGFPNRHSVKILERAGYHAIGLSEGWVKPLRAQYKLERYMHRVVARGAAAPIDAYLALADAIRPQGRTRHRAELLARADERFDRLWARAAPNYRITGERTAAYLNWRYAEFPTESHQFFCLSEPESGELVGYMAFLARGRKIFVADFFALDMRESAARLLTRFGRAMRRAGRDSVFIGHAGAAEFDARLRRLGFYPSTDRDRQLVAWTGDCAPEVQQLVADRESWHLFEGEMDI